MAIASSRVLQFIRPILLAVTLIALGRWLMARWNYDYHVPFIESVIALSVVAEWGLRARKALSLYQDSKGRPRKVVPMASAILFGEKCPSCGGDLFHALANDDWGLQLSVASGRMAYSDGTPCFERTFLGAEAQERLDQFRGVGHGAWCEHCQQFWL